MKKQLLKIGLAFLGIIGISSVANAQTNPHWLATVSGGAPLFNGEYRGNHLAVDVTGNTYSTGSYKSATTSANSIISVYSVGKTGAGGTAEFSLPNKVAISDNVSDNSFIAKTDKDGKFEWAVGFGSTHTGTTAQNTITNTIALDYANSNVYVGGNFNGTIKFSDAFPGVADVTASSGMDGLLVKVTTSGAYQWHKVISGIGTQSVTGVATDSDGDVIAIGVYSGTATIDGTTITNSGTNIFVAKFHTDGSLVYVKSFNGATAWGLAVDADKSIYVSGSFTTSITFDSEILTGSGTTTYLAKLDSEGIPIWAKAITSAGVNVGHGVAVDNEIDKGVYVTGQVASDGTEDINFGGLDVPFTSNLSGVTRLASPYIAKFSTATGNPVWAEVFKTTGAAGAGYLAAINENKELFVGGYARTIDIDGAITATNDNGFIVKLNSETGAVLDKKFIDTGGTDRLNGLAANNTAVYANGIAGGVSRTPSASPTNPVVTENFAGTGSDYAFRGASWDVYIMKWGSTTLPVSLTEFKGSRTSLGNLLTWRTLSETDNQYFELERSSDGINFSSIKRIGGAGTSTEKLSYSYLDTHPLSGVNYYRLKQVDKNAAFSYSEDIVAINGKLVAEGLVVYPNPGLGVVNVQLPSLSVDTEINVYNQGGKLVESYAGISNNNHVIDISKQPSGVYYIQVIENGKSKLSKYIKQ